MSNWVKAVVIFGTGEVIALGLFYIVRKAFQADKSEQRLLDSMSGAIERLVILCGFYMGISQVLAMFGVFKGAIRLKPSEDSNVKKTNEYFFIGNLLSVLLVLVYYWIYTRWRNQ